jgi:hypothetical protein
MKIPVLAVALFVGTTAFADAQPAPVEYASVIDAAIVSPICSSDDFASGAATGDVAGTFSIAFDCSGDTVIGGSWGVVVLAPDAEGTLIEVSGLRGRVVSATFQRDASGNVVTVAGEVAITQGAGPYEAVVSGAGTFEAAIDAAGTPQVRATLRLSF